MNKKKNTSRNSPWVALALFTVAMALISLSTVNGVRAALTVQSEEYFGTFDTWNIQIALVENGTVVEGVDSLKLTGIPQTSGTNAFTKGTENYATAKFAFDTAYPEQLATKNTGEIDQFVRVEVYHYWEQLVFNPQTNQYYYQKATDLDPYMVNIDYNDNDWTRLYFASTPEKEILFYQRTVAPGEVTEPFVRSINISSMIPTLVSATSSQTTEDELDMYGNVVKTTTVTTNNYYYDYDGVRLVIEVEADALQTHNAGEAILAAWGRRAMFNDDYTQIVDIY